jgi:hypothetical protein
VARVSEPLARLYDLALRALDQERRADALRGRLGPTLAAAAALGVTLLSGPLVGGARSATPLGTLAPVLAVGGLLVSTAAAFRILGTRRRPSATIDPRLLAVKLAEQHQLDEPRLFYAGMINRLGAALDYHAEILARLERTFTAMLCGILVMLCGLAIRAVVG